MASVKLVCPRLSTLHDHGACLEQQIKLVPGYTGHSFTIYKACETTVCVALTLVTVQRQSAPSLTAEIPDELPTQRMDFGCDWTGTTLTE